MHRHLRHRHKRTAPGPALACLLFGLAALPAVSAQPLTDVAGGAVRVRLPAGWSVQQLSAGGAVISAKNPHDGLVEMMVWPIPEGGEASALAAAAAQETALYRMVPYARTAERRFVTDAGLEGLWVEGEVKPPDGPLAVSVFVAFAGVGKYYIIGTFCPPEAAGRLHDGPFRQIVRSVMIPGVTPGPADPAPRLDMPPVVPAVPAPPLRPPLEPVPQPGAALPGPPRPGETRPDPVPRVPDDTTTPKSEPPTGIPTGPTPAPQPDPGPVVVTYRDPAGFQLEHPEGFLVRLRDGRVEVVEIDPADGTTPLAGAVIWPLAGVDTGWSTAELADRVLARWPLTAASRAGLVRSRYGPETIYSGTVTSGGALRRVVLSAYSGRSEGLVTAIFAAPQLFAERHEALSRIVQSFRGGPWWTEGPGQMTPPSVRRWTDERHGMVQAPVPEGWQVHGGVEEFNGMASINLEVKSAVAPHYSLRWHLPLTPAYRDLTQVLRNLGWQEDDRYTANPGDSPLRVMPRPSPERYLREKWLQTDEGGGLAQVVWEEVREDSRAAALVGGYGARGVVASLRGESPDGPRRRIIVLAIGDAPTRIGAHCWQAAVLQCEGPAEDIAPALAALRRMVNEADVVIGDRAVSATELAELLRGARSALEAVEDTPAQTGFFSVLAHPAAAGRGEMWSQSPEAGGLWRRAVSLAEQGRAVTKELPQFAE